MTNAFEFDAISPMLEMGAYEWLWNQKHGSIQPSFKTLSKLFSSSNTHLFSELVDPKDAESSAYQVLERFQKQKLGSFSIQLEGAGDFPKELQDAEYPVRLLYKRGDWDLVASQKIAIVGSRNPSEEGIRRAQKLTTILVSEGFTIVSGLAEGIDTAAHETAIEKGGRTIAVIGTPINEVYPKKNNKLQEKIAEEHLLISQIPVLRYAASSPQTNRFFFPERNITMSALSKATVIVEAGNTSGSLIQARAALRQKRKLFILENNFTNTSLKWPQRFETMGAIRIKSVEEILFHLNVNTSTSQN